MPRLWLAALCALWGAASIAGAQRVGVELQAPGPQVTIALAGRGELEFSLGIEIGSRPNSRWVQPDGLVAQKAVTRGVSGRWQIDGDYELEVVVREVGGGAVSLKSLLRNAGGDPEPVYYYWSWALPTRALRAPAWGGEPETVTIGKGWGDGGYRDWFWLDYGEDSLGLVTPMYLLTGGENQGNRCFLKPFPVERQLLRSGGPGLEQQLVMWPTRNAPEAAAGWERLIARPGLFDVPWARLPEASTEAPEWLRDTSAFEGWYYPWSEGTVQGRLKTISLAIGAPLDSALVDLAREEGVRTAIYINPMEAWVAKPVTQRGYDTPLLEFSQWLDLANWSEWWRVATDGRPSAGETEWWTSHYPCFRAPGYIEHCVETVERVLDLAPDAVFIDNCFFLLPSCAGDHTHRDDYLNDMAAYRGLVDQISDRAHERGIAVLCNSEVDPDLWGTVDGQMYECLLYCPGWAERNKGWTQMRYAGELWSEAVGRGGTVQMLHYLGIEKLERRAQAAMFLYAWCRLYGLMWSDWFSLLEVAETKDIGRELIELDLGRPKGAPICRNGCPIRRFERGVVALNPFPGARELRVPALRRHHRLVGSEEPGPPISGETITLAGQSAAIAVYR